MGTFHKLEFTGHHLYISCSGENWCQCCWLLTVGWSCFLAFSGASTKCGALFKVAYNNCRPFIFRQGHP
jgi:hypothetical protein